MVKKYYIPHPDRVKIADILRNQRRFSSGAHYDVPPGYLREDPESVPVLSAEHAWKQLKSELRDRNRHWLRDISQRTGIYSGKIRNWSYVPEEYVQRIAFDTGRPPASIRPDLFA